MNALIILLVAIAVLVCGYVFYGGWLAKQWGIDPNRPTPAHEFEDGKDYVPAAPYVVLGHHFSSIAGAGPINGPIQVAIFGHAGVCGCSSAVSSSALRIDFGALFAHPPQEGDARFVIAENIDDTAKKLSPSLSYLTLILRRGRSALHRGEHLLPWHRCAGRRCQGRGSRDEIWPTCAAMISGAVHRGSRHLRRYHPWCQDRGREHRLSSGHHRGRRGPRHNLPVIALDNTTWMILVGLYILVASVAPVWILLQPRDCVELSALRHDRPGACRYHRRRRHGQRRLAGHSRIHRLFRCGWHIQGGCLGLFVPGAVHHHRLRRHLRLPQPRGLGHYLQAARSRGRGAAHRLRRHAARVLGGGHLAVRGGLRVFGYMEFSTYASPTQVFAAGLSQMLACVPGLAGAESVAYALLVLAVSVFCLTSLDTATRLGRYMFQELFTPHGMEASDLTGWRAVLVNPWVATIITVVLGVGLGMTGYQLVWPLFGAANQLLAALGLLAVCAWLGNAGRNNKMFYVPMAFMMVVTLTSLALTVWAKIGLLAAGTVDAATVLQLVIGVLLMVFAVILAVKGCKTIFGKKRVA